MGKSHGQKVLAADDAKIWSSRVQSDLHRRRPEAAPTKTGGSINDDSAR